jgi:hypothetical protein
LPIPETVVRGQDHRGVADQEARQSVAKEGLFFVQRMGSTTLIALGREFAATVVGYYLESRLADYLERNRQRSGKASVPDVALYATRKRLCRPSLAEGFDRLSYVRLLGDGRFEILDWTEELRDDEAG